MYTPFLIGGLQLLCSSIFAVAIATMGSSSHPGPWTNACRKLWNSVGPRGLVKISASCPSAPTWYSMMDLSRTCSLRKAIRVAMCTILFEDVSPSESWTAALLSQKTTVGPVFGTSKNFPIPRTPIVATVAVLAAQYSPWQEESGVTLER